MQPCTKIDDPAVRKAMRAAAHQKHRETEIYQFLMRWRSDPFVAKRITLARCLIDMQIDWERLNRDEQNAMLIFCLYEADGGPYRRAIRTGARDPIFYKRLSKLVRGSELEDNDIRHLKRALWKAYQES